MHVASADKAILLFLLLLVAAFCFAETKTSIAAEVPSGAASSTNARIVEGYGKLPLSFEANRGQTDSRVQFLSRGQGYTLFLTSREAVITLARPVARQNRLDKRFMAATAEEPQATPSAVVRLQLAGANRKPVITQEDELPAKSNYFIGKDPAKWRTNISNYGRVRYHEIYPGIDLVYYGNQRQLEHDFVVGPGADPSHIKLRLRGVQNLYIEEDDLVMSTAQGELRLLKPEIYQEVNGARRQVPGRYVLKGGNEVGFAMAKFDRSRELVIDPVLSYSTYLGGSGEDSGYGIAVDSSGNAYVVGSTRSTDFPTLNPIQHGPGPDYPLVFVAKLSTTGTLVYSTYIGGNYGDVGYSIAVDSTGNAYITGSTHSSGFPTTANAYQSSLNGGGDAFVTKLNSAGSALLYSTYFGGSSYNDTANGIAVDSSGNAYIVGFTDSPDLPIIKGPYGPLGNYYTHAFVAEFDTTTGKCLYSTYLGGDSYDYGYGIDVDNAGNIYVTGQTESDDFPTTAGAFQTNVDGSMFVTKLKPDGSLPVYSTYLGNANNGGAYPNGIVVNRVSGTAYVTGFVEAYNTGAVLPVSANAFQKTINAALWYHNAFVVALTADGSSVPYCTYLGGSKDDFGDAIALDSAGNVYVTGAVSSTDFPTQNPIQSTNRTVGGYNAFVAKLNTDFSALIYSTYLGGSSYEDQGNAIAVDSLGAAYVTGVTSSTDFPTANAFQSSFGGGSDAFVAKISGAAPAPVLSLSPSTLTFRATAGGSNPAAKPIAVTNTGTGTLSWSASYTSTWLALDSTSGLGVSSTTPATINASAIVSGLAAGTYNDTITVTSAGVVGSPATVGVSLTVTDFTLSADSSSLDLQRGQNGTVHLTVTPLSGFNQTVSFACSGLPSGASCSFSPSAITPQGSAVTSTLTVSASTTAEQRHNRHLPWTGVSVILAICSLGFGVRRSRKSAMLLLLLLAATAGILQIGCGGGFKGTTPASTVLATPTTTNVIVTATAGSLQHQVTFALTTY